MKYVLRNHQSPDPKFIEFNSCNDFIEKLKDIDLEDGSFHFSKKSTFGTHAMSQMVPSVDNEIVGVSNGIGLIGHVVGEKTEVEKFLTDYENKKEAMKKGSVIKVDNYRGVVCSRNYKERLIYFVDFNNNINTISEYHDFSGENTTEIDLDGVVYCLLGLEDERFDHQDKESSKVSKNMEINNDQKKLNELLHSKLRGLHCHEVETYPGFIKVSVNELEEPIVINYKIPKEKDND